MSSLPAEPRPRRGARLFTRLLWLQLGQALGLGLVIWALFYVERNMTVATLYAELWAPQLTAAAGLQTVAPAENFTVARRSAPPPRARQVSAWAPRFTALRQALRARGLPVQEVRLEFGSPTPMVWMRVSSDGAEPLWLGAAGQIVAPEWPFRAVIALLSMAALVVSLSWWAARRLARPLEALRQRVERQQPEAPFSPLGEAQGAPPEVAAIDAAYADLLARWQRQQRERALLLAGVSHDLRSPLGRIRLAAELLPDGPDWARRKAAIVRNVGDADRLIESFLDFVRAGELPCDETVDVADAARRVLAGFDRPSDQLALSAPSSLHVEGANTLLVQRLIANLTDNALKHGRPPVRVHLSGGSGEPVTLAVEDAGDGLAPHQLEALQEAFRRGDAARSQAGSGLGLAIVRQVAARTGGRILFEQGAGCQRVSVVWPAGMGRRDPGPA